MRFYSNLPYGARRIDFEPEYRIPDYTFERLYYRPTEPELLNNKGQFFVHISEKNPYVEQLVHKAQDLGLTVSGDGTARVKGGDIREARKGDQITFGSSKNFDVNWVKRNEYFCGKGFAPVYDIAKDWNKIDKAMKQFADDKKALRFDDGTNVHFHARFMVVDGRVVSYKRDEVLVAIPERVLRNIIDEYDIIQVAVLRNRY